MTNKKLRIVTLRSSPPASVDVPEEFPKKRGQKEEARAIERSVVGTLRLFPGVPKTVTKDELEYMSTHRPDVAARLDEREYVESKRKALRGYTEAEVRELAEKEGIGHLSFKKQEAALLDRGKLTKAKRIPVKVVMKGKSKKAAPVKEVRAPTVEKKKPESR